MAYDNEKLNYGKEHIYIVDLLLTGCTQTSGVAPCLATETGDNKCFNTLETCNFLEAYTPSNTVNFLRFYQSRSPAPIGMAGSTIIDAIPCLKSVNIAPTKIDLSGGLGVRASVSCTFTDFPHSDISIDKYLDERTYIASDRGTFWTKLRARNPDYQNKELRVLSGFLVDGVFDINNFKTRYYIVDKMTVTNGMCTIVAKDPLKLTSNKKAQAPAVSIGRLLNDITDSDVVAKLTPPGIGNLEYPSSGKMLIGSEVIQFLRNNDELGFTGGRGASNTVAAEHKSNDTAQLCLEYEGVQVDTIIRNLLVDFANIDPLFIPDLAWSAEVNEFLAGGLSAIIVKPFDVFKLLKELAESMPHYLWWDENEQVIQLTALKEITDGSNTINMDNGIIANSFKTVDKPELRKSSIFVNFGQFDPTKKLDEFSNYQQTYARIDSVSIAKYGSNEIHTINSRWITTGNKGAALQLGALIGRRFSDVPREINFSLEVKDSDIWVGQSIVVNHRDVVDFTGLPVDTVYQILSSKDNVNLDYSCLEFTYGDKLDQDPEEGTDTVFIPTTQNYNMLTEYTKLFPAGPNASTRVVFVVEDGVTVGSTSTVLYSIETGAWPVGAEITLQTDIGSFVVGRGGDGGPLGSALPTLKGKDGGTAIRLQFPLLLINNGVIGGGGGGGGSAYQSAIKIAGGGGGAGNDGGGNNGVIGSGSSSPPTNGQTETGGIGGQAQDFFGDPDLALAGTGGDLGDTGETGKIGLLLGVGGAPGDSIDKNGKTLTIDPLSEGSILGDIVG